MSDPIILGGVSFTDFAAPEKMPFGGRQAMAIHKLPGGQRVIDTLGPDDEDISWSGRFWGADALSRAQALDEMRASGQAQALAWGGMAYVVIVAEFKAVVEHLPNNVSYTITCTITQNPMQGAFGGVSASLDTLVAIDLASIVGVSSSLMASVGAVAVNAAGLSPLASAGGAALQNLAGQANGATASLIAALPAAAGQLDTYAGDTSALNMATSINGLLESAQTQSSLVDAVGFAGRAATNILQVGA